MPSVLTLQVPVDAPFRALAGEAAGRLLTILGGTADEATVFQTAVADAASEIAPQGRELTVTFDAAADRVEVRVTCGAAARLLTHRLSGRLR